jgi:hypothetical protein
LAHPASIKLCDVRAKRPVLEALAQELRQAHGFHGQIIVATGGGKAPDAAYGATLLIGATSVPDVIEVDRLAPGTLIVDDSFPPCLPVEAAAERLQSRGDILFTAGGFVRAPAPLRRMLSLPAAASRYAGRSELRRSLGGRGEDEITGCILSGLLSLARPDLQPQLGPVEPAACRAHLAALRELGFGAASLGLGGFSPSASAVAAFRQRHGALAAA